MGVDGSLAPTIQRLVHENATLREAFNDANRRLSRLEDEKLRFFDEGIFDLVNSVCGKSTVFTKHGGNHCPRAWSYEPQASVAASPSPLALSPRSSPHVPERWSPDTHCVAHLRRSEEERRSAVLSDENEELRRELARASEVGEALEQQQQAAEDRMHALEEEQAWLAERLSRLTAGLDGLAVLDASPGPTRVGPRADTAALQEANRLLRLELRAAEQRQEELLRATDEACLTHGLLTESRQEQLQAAPPSQVVHGQLEALEQRLRDTEARAQLLAEENARLQAALSVPRDSLVVDCAVPTTVALDAASGATPGREPELPAAAETGPEELPTSLDKLVPIELEEAW